ncbi:hypothetical protein ENT52713_23790 [Enterobacter sp. 200527-13]|nr:hypothetical protein ENT52713_23790 [Enterobacter sp. 200527-13]
MDLSEMTQTMTDDVKRIMGAFREVPVMTLQVVTTMTGLSEHTTRFILEQLRKAGDAQAQYMLAGNLAARGEYGRSLALMKQAEWKSLR